MLDSNRPVRANRCTAFVTAIALVFALFAACSSDEDGKGSPTENLCTPDGCPEAPAAPGPAAEPDNPGALVFMPDPTSGVCVEPGCMPLLPLPDDDPFPGHDPGCAANADCDDGDPCTTDTCTATGCASASISGCGEPPPQKPTPDCAALCQLSGASGAPIICPMQIAASSQTQPKATGLQFLLFYDPELVTLENFFDEACFEGAGCFDIPLTGSGAMGLSTGHSISPAPPDPANWKGSVGALLVNIGDSTKPLADAWLDGAGGVHGDPLFMEAHFTLNADIPDAEASPVCMESLLAGDYKATTLTVELIDGLMVTTEQTPED